MPYHPRIENGELGNFVTTRSRASELWFVNNSPLERTILGYAAKYASRHEVSLYALAIEGNHIQMAALFPKGNRGAFMQVFNSMVARATARLTPEYPGGKFWGRRYSNEFLPGAEDIEEYFWYTVLQPIQDGLVEKLSDYPGYNCFHDAIYGIPRKFKVLRLGEFNARKRYRKNLSLLDCSDEVTLTYARLPGYEDMPQREYAKMMLRKLEERRQEIVKARYAAGKGFAGREALLNVERGSKPHTTKTSSRFSHRPRILSVCDERRAKWKAWYFDIYFAYRECSKRYRDGDLSVVFPAGTYPPWRPAVPTSGSQVLAAA